MIVQHRYTEEQKNFICDIAAGRYNAEIADLFNTKFGTSITGGQIKAFKANHKINSNVPKRRQSTPEGLFSKEQYDFIAKNVKGLSNQKLADLVNETFNLLITTKQIKTWKKNHGLSSELKGSEGMDPPNKGTKGLYNVGGNRTSFKKGQQPVNYKSVGYERIDRDGYVLVKVQDDGPWHKRWKHKHKVIWEQFNGPIPEGHVVIFGDGDKSNLDPDNLLLITKAQLARLNQHHLIQSDRELTKIGITIADIHNKIGERKRKKAGR